MQICPLDVVWLRAQLRQGGWQAPAAAAAGSTSASLCCSRGDFCCCPSAACCAAAAAVALLLAALLLELLLSVMKLVIACSRNHQQAHDQMRRRAGVGEARLARSNTCSNSAAATAKAAAGWAGTQPLHICWHTHPASPQAAARRGRLPPRAAPAAAPLPPPPLPAAAGPVGQAWWGWQPCSAGLPACPAPAGMPAQLRQLAPEGRWQQQQQQQQAAQQQHRLPAPAAHACRGVCAAGRAGALQAAPQLALLLLPAAQGQPTCAPGGWQQLGGGPAPVQQWQHPAPHQRRPLLRQTRLVLQAASCRQQCSAV